MRDTKYRVDQPGENVEAKDKNAYMEKARAFLKREVAREALVDAAEPVRRKRKAGHKPPARVSAYDLLISKNNALLALNEHGLDSYRPKDTEEWQQLNSRKLTKLEV